MVWMGVGLWGGGGGREGGVVDDSTGHCTGGTTNICLILLL